MLDASELLQPPGRAALDRDYRDAECGGGLLLTEAGIEPQDNDGSMSLAQSSESTFHGVADVDGTGGIVGDLALWRLG